MNIKRIGCLVVPYLVLVHIAFAKSYQGTLLDKIIANVDNQIVLQSELDTACQQYLLQGGQELPDLKCKLLERLIINKMLLSKAQQEGVVVDKELIVQECSARMQYLLAQAGSEVALVQYLDKSIEAIKSELCEKIREQLMLERMREKCLSAISVTPKEVKESFESLPVQAQPYYPAEVVVRQIVRYPQASQQEKNTLIAQLKDLKVRLQNGEDFEVLAKAYSQDPSSAPKGGALGFRRLGQLMPAYEAAALALQPGEVSDLSLIHI